MNYTIPAIETRYNGVQFRSRLEAKWAAMFDLLGWEWTYEPTDFNGWIPDFAIHGNRIIYVEVKPVEEFPHEAAAKMDKSGCDHRMLIVGGRAPFAAAAPHFIGTDEFMVDGLPYFGWCQHPEYACWEPAAFGRHWCDDYIGFMGTGYSLADYTRKHQYEIPHNDRDPGQGVSLHEIELLWREASNKTRWNPI